MHLKTIKKVIAKVMGERCLYGPMTLVEDTEARRLRFIQSKELTYHGKELIALVKEVEKVVLKKAKKPHKKPGPKFVTGRFETRSELVDKILFLSSITSCNDQRIADNCRVSVGTVAKIIRSKK